MNHYLPTVYRYKERWWHGGFAAWKTDAPLSLLRELFWLFRNGTWCAGWHWPDLIFGFGRMWYDGPHWHLNLGVLSISLSSD